MGTRRVRVPARASPGIPEWKGAVAKQWLIVEHFQRNGEEFIVARRRSQSPLDRLTRREREVVLAACAGHSNKVIAYDFGISTSTVGVLLWRAEMKVGVRSRRDLARIVREWEDSILRGL